MPINMKNFSANSKKPTDPTVIFSGLTERNEKYGYLRNVQDEVLRAWYANREKKDKIIKMNTGSGKTVVGLLILKSCLNEKKGPAVYVVPDRYLVKQVCKEARLLGIKVVCDEYGEEGNCIFKGEKSREFLEGRAIYITNIHKVVNGKSVFGMRRNFEDNITIGSMVVDDVHACIDTIGEQHTLHISASNPIYNEVVKQLGVNTNEGDNESGNYHILVPFEKWQKEYEAIKKIVDKDPESKDWENEQRFKMPLMRDNWATANCVVTANEIEITLKGTRLDKIRSFDQAERRIYMSATLSDDSALVSTFGLRIKENDEIVISPKKANDIGARVILAPAYLNQKISDEQIRNKLEEYAEMYSIVVIVPSFSRAELWNSQKLRAILSLKEGNIESGIEELRKNPLPGITVLVNRYDGIDLPDDSCRILVLDGLPEIPTEYERFIQGVAPTIESVQCKAMQKVEQGMGRGLRSNLDYCAVILMGDDLIKFLKHGNNIDYFSVATQIQYSTTNSLMDEEVELKDVFELISTLLDEEYARSNGHEDFKDGWYSLLSDVEYSNKIRVKEQVVNMRKAFEAERAENYEDAYLKVKSLFESEGEKLTRGLLKYLMAEYKNFTDPVEAKILHGEAYQINIALPRPENLTIRREKYNSNKKCWQGERALKYKGNYPDLEHYLEHINGVIEKLRFCFGWDASNKEGNSKTKGFERALKEVGDIIGLESSCPEGDKTIERGGPDNLTRVDENEYLVIECKNGVMAKNPICKNDCAQLLSSVEWFKRKYISARYTPVLVHPNYCFMPDASPSEDFRIMGPTEINRLVEAIKRFCKAVQDRERKDGEVIKDQDMQRLIDDYELTGSEFVNKYTIKGKK